MGEQKLRLFVEMDQLKLTDDEWKCYADYFSSCDLEGSGRVPLGRAMELFQTSHLSTEQLVHIVQISGAKRVGHFGRSHFYIALRCIALIQAGIPSERVTVDSLRWQQFESEAHLPKLSTGANARGDKPPETPARISAVPSQTQPPVPPPKFAIRRLTVASGEQPKVAVRSHAPFLPGQHSLTGVPLSPVTNLPTVSHQTVPNWDRAARYVCFFYSPFSV